MEAQHALQIPVVVQNLFTLMAPTISFHDLKSARGVCRTWYQECLSVWRKNAVLTFYDKPFFFPVLSSKGIQPTGFLVVLDSPQDFYALDVKPFEKCKIVDLKMDMEHLQENREVAKFWELLGPNITHLTLDNVKFSTKSDSSFQKILIDFLRAKTPGLEHLKLASISLDGDDGRLLCNNGPLTIDADLPSLKSLTLDRTMDFKFENFPNLQKLKLVGGRDLVTMFNSGTLVNSSIITLNLLDNKYLMITNNIIDPIRFTALQNLAISVEYYYDFIYNLEQVSFFLKNHLNTLRSVHLLQSNLYFDVVSSPFRVKMNVLTELKLWGQVFPDLSFIRKLPNLKTLHVDVLGFEKATHVRDRLDTRTYRIGLQWLETDLVKAALENVAMKRVELPHLTNLFLSSELSIESVRALGEWMPNLRILQAILNSTTLPVVIERWEDMEILHCLYGSLLLNEDLLALKTLKRLRRFRYDAVCDKSRLCSVQSFLPCSELTDLQICVSEEFSNKEELKVREKIQFVKIFRNYETNPAHKSWKCCKFKEYINFVCGSPDEENQDSISSISDSSEENDSDSN